MQKEMKWVIHKNNEKIQLLCSTKLAAAFTKTETISFAKKEKETNNRNLVVQFLLRLLDCTKQN